MLSISFIALLSGVSATDRLPTYDYAGGNYNLSCFNSPPYNTTSRSYDFGPAGNQYCELVQNFSTTNFPTNDTPFSVLSYVKPSFPSQTGQAYTMLLLKGYNFASNTGHNLRFELNSTGCIRAQMIDGGNFHTGTFICGFGNNVWVPITWEWTGTTYVATVNGTTSLNTTASGVALGTGTYPDKLFGEGVGGGTANGMFNGTAKPVMVYNRTITATERTTFANNGTMSTTSLLALWTFENTTSAQLSIDTSSFIRTLPADFIGFHSALSPCANETWVDTDGDGTAETLANYTQCQSLLNATGNKQLRLISELWNICQYENATTGTCVYNYTNSSNNNYKNFRSQVSLVAFAALTNSTMKVNINSMPPWLATNNSECSYGLTGSTQEDCDATTYSSTRGYGSAVGRYLIDLGCFSYGKHVCDVEGDNEPYLSQFYLPNSTAVPTSGSCTLRTTRINNHYNSTFVNTKAYLTTAGVNQSLVRWVSPSYTTSGISSCAEAAGTNFSITFPRLGSNSPDLMNWHPYSISSTMGLCTEFATIENIMSSNGWDGYYLNTESEWNNAAVSNASDQSEKTAGLGKALTCLVQNTTVDSHLWYKLASITTAAAETENYIGFRPTAIQTPMLVRGSILMNNITQTIQKGGDVYSCSSNSGSVDCAFVKHNATYGLVVVSNFQNQQLDIDNISISGVTIGSVTKYSNNSTETISNGVIDPSYLKYYGVELYQVTFNVSNISATYTPSTYIVNISEPSSQTFNLTLTNPSSQTYNIVWRNSTGGSPLTACSNLTSCTFTGSYTSAGQYNWSVTVTGETNTLTNVWLLQVNNTVTNISFTSTTPTNSTVNITEGDSQTFSYVLNNSGNFTTYTNWYRDGNNVSACYGQTSCQFTSLSTGTFTINVTVSAANTISNEWTMIVNDGSGAVTASICANTSDAVGELSAWLVTIALVIGAAIVIGTIMLFNSGGISTGDLSIGGLGTIATILVGAAITISIAAMIIASAVC